LVGREKKGGKTARFCDFTLVHEKKRKKEGGWERTLVARNLEPKGGKKKRKGISPERRRKSGINSSVSKKVGDGKPTKSFFEGCREKKKRNFETDNFNKPKRKKKKRAKGGFSYG